MIYKKYANKDVDPQFNNKQVILIIVIDRINFRWNILIGIKMGY
jgi:hypothetical protein